MFRWERFTKRLPRAVLVCGWCLALFAGVGLARAILLPSTWWLLAFVPCALLCFWRHGWVALGALVVLGFGIGWWRGSQVAATLLPYTTYLKQPVVVVGQASNDGVYGNHSQLTFGLQKLRLVSPVNVALPGNINVAGFGAPYVFRGDTVQVSGKLYAGFGGTQGELQFAKLQVLARHTSVVDRLRQRFTAGLQTALPEPQASFGLGLLIGQRSTLPADVSHTLLVVGLSHIIAVSGYNLTIIITVLRRMLAKRSKFQMATGCVTLTLLFLAITGNSPSIVRAAIISMLSLWAWYYGRTIKPVALLLSAGAITVLANPLYVWGNSSWYLSFLAFFGVVAVGPLLAKRLFSAREPPLLLAILLESISAEAATLPYVLHVFGQMSLVSLLANVLVAVFVPLAMLLCVVAGLAGMFAPLVAGWPSWPARELLTYMLDASRLISRTPHSFLGHIGFSMVMMFVTYLIIGIWIWFLQRAVLRKYAIITETNQLAGQKEYEVERTQ